MCFAQNLTVLSVYYIILISDVVTTVSLTHFLHYRMLFFFFRSYIYALDVHLHLVRDYTLHVVKKKNSLNFLVSSVGQHPFLL